tara:strand:- start:12246 stop:12518 length:273 start_codon:yes stop_codon:yes gene_type:complete
MSVNLENLSPIAKSLIAILNNVDELVTQTNDRTAAKDVMKAFKIYANSKNYPIPTEKVDDFMDVIFDSRSITITYLVRNIAEEIINSDLT